MAGFTVAGCGRPPAGHDLSTDAVIVQRAMGVSEAFCSRSTQCTRGFCGIWRWPSSAHRLRLSLQPALSVRGRPPTGRPPPAGGNGSTTQDRESISLPVASIPARGFSHKTRLSGARFRLDPYAREVDWAWRQVDRVVVGSIPARRTPLATRAVTNR